MISFFIFIGILIAGAFVASNLESRISNRYLRTLVAILAVLVVCYIAAMVLGGIVFSSGDPAADGAKAGFIMGEITAMGILALMLRLVWDFVRPVKKKGRYE